MRNKTLHCVGPNRSLAINKRDWIEFNGMGRNQPQADIANKHSFSLHKMKANICKVNFSAI